VQVHTVSPESLQLSVPATGRLAARESVDLVSELSRRLKRVRFQEGTQVKKGDVLFELDASDLHAQLAQLRVQVELGRVSAERQATLSKEGLGSLQEAQTAQAEYDALQAQQRVLEVTLSKATLRAPFAGTVGLRRVSEGAWLSPSTVLVTLHDTSQLKLDFTLPERYAKLLSTGKTVNFRAEGHTEALVGTIVAF
jgi:membrane fusion protein, multidrug efflux system